MNGRMNWATFAPKPKRVLPLGNMDRDIQQCTRLRASLTTASCAARWERSGRKHGKGEYMFTPYTVCAGCEIGRGNYIRELGESTQAESSGESDKAVRARESSERPTK